VWHLLDKELNESIKQSTSLNRVKRAVRYVMIALHHKSSISSVELKLTKQRIKASDATSSASNDDDDELVDSSSTYGFVSGKELVAFCNQVISLSLSLSALIAQRICLARLSFFPSFHFWLYKYVFYIYMWF
jgi:hypothetical protein